MDELGACTALRTDHGRNDTALSATVDDLNRILSRLMTVEALLAADERGREKVTPLSPETVSWLEGRIDALQAILQPLDKFTIPGGHPAASQRRGCPTLCPPAGRGGSAADARHGAAGAARVGL